MVISSITASDVAQFLRLDDAMDTLLTPMMAVAKQFIMDYTGMTAEELDEHEDFYIAYMVLVQDMYDNRVMYVDKDGVNRVVESILFRHRTNFLPSYGFTEEDPEEPEDDTTTEPTPEESPEETPEETPVVQPTDPTEPTEPSEEPSEGVG